MRRSEQEKMLYTWAIDETEDAVETQRKLVRDGMRALGSLPTGAALSTTEDPTRLVELRCVDMTLNPPDQKVEAQIIRGRF